MRVDLALADQARALRPFTDGSLSWRGNAGEQGKASGMVGGLDAVLQAFATALRSLCEQWRTGDEQVYRGRVEVWSGHLA